MRILLVEGNTWVSPYIKALTNSRFSHCAILLDDFTTVEADWGGIFRRDLRTYPWRWEVIEYEVTHSQELAAKTWAIELLEKAPGYDYLQNLGILFAIMTGWEVFARVLDSKRLFECSETCALFLRKGGVTPPRHKSIAVPEDFWSDHRAIHLPKYEVTREMRALDRRKTRNVD